MSTDGRMEEIPCFGDREVGTMRVVSVSVIWEVQGFWRLL